MVRLQEEELHCQKPRRKGALHPEGWTEPSEECGVHRDSHLQEEEELDLKREQWRVLTKVQNGGRKPEWHLNLFMAALWVLPDKTEFSSWNPHRKRRKATVAGCPLTSMNRM